MTDSGSDQDHTIHHFSQNNPKGPGQDDVPALLRRVADTLDSMGTLYIQDIVFHSEIAQDGVDRPSLTVYFDREQTENEASSA